MYTHTHTTLNTHTNINTHTNTYSHTHSHSQEPGTPKQIKEYAAGYGVQFDMFDKIDVNGSHTHPLYRFLKSHCRGGLGSFVRWNFEKVGTFTFMDRGRERFGN